MCVVPYAVFLLKLVTNWCVIEARAPFSNRPSCFVTADECCYSSRNCWLLLSPCGLSSQFTVLSRNAQEEVDANALRLRTGTLSKKKSGRQRNRERKKEARVDDGANIPFAFLQPAPS